jgi:hypothetical protein
MKIDRVTITGADDSTDIEWLVRMTERFPFVEWGILASESSQGRYRFPSPRWITDLQGVAIARGGLPLSLHLCGRWVRQLLVGELAIPPSLLDCFTRVQLNFHAERTRCDGKAFASALDTIKGKDFIFQFDGATGNKHMEAAMENDFERCFVLFDVSGGAGIVPKQWPKPEMIDVFPGEHGEGVEQPAYCGYAGGLGPKNLSRQLPLIAAAAGDARIWIDMETWVRTPDDSRLDCLAVESVLTQMSESQYLITEVLES